ncbi:MAG: hypothetical protein WCV73_04160 [Patescibacteria group bacterium]|jgi:3D (Asp-Asp-Asp) domain-containing protein
MIIYEILTLETKSLLFPLFYSKFLTFLAKISRKIIKKNLLVLDKILPFYLLLVVLNLNLPHVQAEDLTSLNVQLPVQTGKIEVLRAFDPTPSGLPLDISGQLREPRFKLKVWVSAYNSLPGQTDSTPCITASGLDVCKRAEQGAVDVIATNLMHLPFGTKIRMPELFGDKIFLVEDRMNRRYTKKMDIWMADYDEAIKFGHQYTSIEIF